MRFFWVALTGLIFSFSVYANELHRGEFGTDSYRAGETIIVNESKGSVFAAGEVIEITAPTTGALHLAAQNIELASTMQGPVYAAAQNIEFSGVLEGDITAFAQTISLDNVLKGTGRFFAQTLEVNASVEGNLLVFAERLELNDVIKGDLRFFGEALRFGPNARIEGQVRIYSHEKLAVPQSVASDVSYEILDEWNEDYSEDWDSESYGFGSTVFFFFAGLVLLYFLRGRFERALDAMGKGLWQCWKRGIFYFMVLLGLVPLLILTLLGIPLLFLVVPLIILLSVAGYIFGLSLLVYGLLFRQKDFSFKWVFLSFVVGFAFMLSFQALGFFVWGGFCILGYLVGLALVPLGLAGLFIKKTWHA